MTFRISINNTWRWQHFIRNNGVFGLAVFMDLN